ncbi:MAG: type IV toxin-antitoxin system AbiEi family antitoxin [Bacteroidota bacterium]
MRDVGIVNSALESLLINSQIRGEWKDNAKGKDNGIDGEIIFNINSKKIKISIAVKKTVRNHQLLQIEEIAKDHKPFLLVVEHIFPRMKEELRQRDIAYMEGNGNIYLKEGDIYWWIDNQKPILPEKETTNRAFGKSGLKVIFHFLLNEELVNYPYREIARIAAIGLGNVNNVLNGLKQDGFLLKDTKEKYRLVHKNKLLEKWMVAYAEKLQPALHIGNFRFLKEADQKNWKQILLAEGKTYWGGEPAADLMTNYLRPEILTLYSEEDRNELIKNYRLVPDEKGKVKVYKKFWNHDQVKRTTTDPLLVYVDLLNTGDGRCMETAKKIFDEYQLGDKF